MNLELKQKNLDILELILFGISILTIFIISLLKNESIISIIYAVCGITYTLFAGKGKVFCYFFGIIATCCYVYLSYENNIYGNCLLNLIYYLPMQLLGIFLWKKHLKKDKKEIIKTRLSTKNRVILTLISIVLSACTIITLTLLHSSQAILDGITTTLSIIAMVLTVKRCIEQWIIWIIVDSLAILMWFKLALEGSQTYTTIIVWTIYLISGLYFYKAWKKEV